MKTKRLVDFYLLMIVVVVAFVQCTPKLFIESSGERKISQVVIKSGFLENQNSGFVLFDPVEGQPIYQLRSDQYFTPASNTKIFTLLSALNYLPETTSLYEVAETSTAVFIRGSGNPALLHPDFQDYQPDFPYANDTTRKYFYVDHHFSDGRYGAGWAWDDYPYGYQVEKTPMPIYANRVTASMRNYKLAVVPDYYQSYFEPNTVNNWPIFREECSNAFYISEEKLEGKKYRLPFIYTPYDHSKMLSKEWGVAINPYYNELPTGLSFNSVGGPPLDTLLKKLMLPSDNFVAEQLLLMITQQEFGRLNTDSAIAFLQRQLFSSAPDQLQWYDGSGLSRYNLFTPRTIVHTLNQIYQKVGIDGVEKFFPVGGRSGTIENWYTSEIPYVFAKTGTLKNNHCLSGFIKTNSGRVLIFSMMNNNFFGGSRPSKLKMETILKYIRDHY